MLKSIPVKHILRNQKGQGVLEYVIISGLIGVFCLVTISNFGETIRNKIKLMDKKVSSKIRIS